VASGHTAVNAIEKCFPLVSALRELEAEMNASVSHPLYRDLKHPLNLNVGKMHGGDWPSSVPALCEFDCRLGYEPGVSPADMRKRVSEAVAAAAARDAWLSKTPPEVTFYGFRSDGWLLNQDSALLKGLAACHKERTGKPLLTEPSTGTDDTRYFDNYYGIPALCYGPSGANIHTADEYVELGSIVTGAQVLADLIMRWCGLVE
jgi:acetylornithine deacetylase